MPKRLEPRMFLLKTVHKIHFQSASVLILVLIVISGMTVIAFGLTYRSRIEIRLSHASYNAAKAHWLAIAGLERCKAMLAEQELDCARTARLCRFISNADKDKLFESFETFDNKSERLIYWIKDELSFLSINESDPASWENLKSISSEETACILDWIDDNSDTNPGGAETDFYERLEPPRTCKNASIITIRELLFVKNVTADSYAGRLVNSASEIEEETAGDEPADFVQLFSAFGDGKININTCDGKMLCSLPGLDEQAVNSVLAFRAGPDGTEGTDDDAYIENDEGISKIDGLTQLQIELLRQYCCFNSDTFRIFSYAQVKEQKNLLMATVKVQDGGPKILSVERLL